MSPFPLALVDGLLAVAFLAMAGVTLRRRERHGALAWATLLLALGVLSLLIGVSRLDIVGFDRAILLLFTGWVTVVPLWAIFTFEYTGRGPLVTRRLVAGLFGFGALVWLFTIGLERGDDLVGGAVSILTGLFQVGLLSLGFFGLFLLGRSAVTYGDMPTGRAALLSAVGICVSFLILPVTVLGLQPPVAEVPPLMTWYLAVISALFLAVQVRHGLFEEVPGTGHVGRQRVLDAMSEAVIVVDRREDVVDANTTAQRTFGFEQSSAVGRHISAVLGADPAAATNDWVNLPTPTGRREFEASISQLTNQQGDLIGRAYLLQDVTNQQTQQQRLAVLNRVLRHNLRNDLDAIRAFAETMRDEPLEAEEAASVADRIETTARELAAIGATVERSEQVLTRDTLERGRVDVPELVEGVVAEIREPYPESAVTISVATRPTHVRTDREVLRTALLEVVENAAEHTDQSPPTVSISVDATDGGVAISVEDDGPGIPERERQVLLEGEETPLRHGTGVGLWLVYWAVTRLGGEISFSEADPRGSRVTLWVPDHSTGAELEASEQTV